MWLLLFHGFTFSRIAFPGIAFLGIAIPSTTIPGIAIPAQPTSPLKTIENKFPRKIQFPRKFFRQPCFRGNFSASPVSTETFPLPHFAGNFFPSSVSLCKIALSLCFSLYNDLYTHKESSAGGFPTVSGGFPAISGGFPAVSDEFPMGFSRGLS